MPSIQRAEPLRSRPRLASDIVAAVVVVGLLAAVVGAWFSGATAPPPQGLTEAGPAVRWALPLVRVVHDVSAALTLGALVFASMIVPAARGRNTGSGGRNDLRHSPRDEPRVAHAFRVAAAAGFVWVVAAVVGVVLGFADAAGLRLSDPSFLSSFTGSVWAIDAFRVGLISAAAAFVVACGSAVARSRWAAAALGAGALVGILVLGLAGHAGGSADHETAVNALAAHLLSSSLWVGGLLALIVLRPTFVSSLPAVVRRYSTLALWCYVTLGISGVMAATTRLGEWADLTTSYGVLLLVKVAAFLLLGVAGWWHRRAIIDALSASTVPSAKGSAALPAKVVSSIRNRQFLRLAAGETLLMGLTIGVATALARSAPPVPEIEPNPSIALALSGFPAPPPPTALSLVTAWRFEWLFLAAGLLAIGLYLVGVRRLRRRGDRWPVSRTINWVVGWLLFIWVNNGMLGIYGRVSFSWHMTLHMTEAMVIPIFLVLGAPVTLALRAVPARTDGTIGWREIVLKVVHSKLFVVTGNPIFAGVFFFFSLIAFYWTGLFELALRTHTGHLLMTAHFLLAGYLFAWVLIGIDPGPRRWRPALRLIVLFATIGFHAFFGVSIISGTTVLAPAFFNTINLSWVTDPLADQRLGGGVAWAIGELPALVLALLVAAQWFKSDRAEARRGDRRADRDGDAELNAYNERLAGLADHENRAGTPS